MERFPVKSGGKASNGTKERSIMRKVGVTVFELTSRHDPFENSKLSSSSGLRSSKSSRYRRRFSREMERFSSNAPFSSLFFEIREEGRSASLAYSRRRRLAPVPGKPGVLSSPGSAKYIQTTFTSQIEGNGERHGTWERKTN